MKRSAARFRWLVIGPFLVAVVLLAALGMASADILSAVRAYVGGESLWSKGEKDAVYHLANYIQTRRTLDYQRFAEAIAIPLGDREARLELERPDPDLAIARRGFAQGGNHADDIDAMIRLFRNFRRVPFMADAIAIWTEADGQIAELNELAEQVRQQIEAGGPMSAQLLELQSRLAPLNERLTQLGQRFSATMGAASRSAQHIVQVATLGLALLLAATAVWFSSSLLRRQSHADQALRASEERFRSLWDTALDAIIVFDERSIVRYANPALAGLLGYAPSEVIGREMALMQPERLRAAHRRGIARYLQSRHRKLDWRSTEVPGLHRDGREIPLEIAFSHSERDGAHQFVGFLRDVSARNRADQALRVSEERLQRALDASQLCLWDFDVQSGSVYLSEAWSQWLGGPAEATRTTFAGLAERVPEDELQAVRAALVAAVKGDTVSYRVEHRVRKIDGSWLWNISEGRVVERDADGQALRMVGTNRDITERKQAEAARRDLEAQVRESQKMEAIGTLASGIAHDFNNILGAILGNVALARDDAGAAPAALQCLEQINKSATRARTLVQQILAFGRHQPQCLVNRPLRPLLEESLALMRTTLPAGVKLDALLCDETLQVLADATQIQQVLLNLCTNAWHALRDEPGRLEVGLEPIDNADGEMPARLAPGAYAHLWVSDDGCGMDRSTLERIFEPFFTTKPVGEGTGLGLSVVHGIVAAHGGTIRVDSVPGRGSTFHVYFPRVDAHDAKPTSSWGELLPLQSQGHGEHVLYLDDDEVMVLLAHQLLDRLGYRVSCFQDPRLALDALRAEPQAFDLVVSDFNMPECSGLDVAREVMRIRADLPVAITSGHLSDEQRSDILRRGVREVIHKENTLEELGPLVTRLLQRVEA